MWYFRLAFSVMTKATQHPYVGGLYSLLSLSLHVVGDEHFEMDLHSDETKFVERGKEMALVLHYLEEVVFQCCQFQHDLLRSR